ncbi:MAG: class I SAM-dependent methyltransferase, partial [Spirochaetota bacterium]
MKRHVCPWWIGYLLASPLRRLRENPDNILTNHVADGMTVMDYGSAMGFFSLPAAKLAGPTGKVICVDIQERMLAALRRRAQKHNMSGRITTVLADEVQSLDTYAGSCDCILAIHVLHEVPDQRATFSL